MNTQQLQDKANEIREDTIKMLVEAGSGHSAGPLGMADVFTALYFGGQLNLDPQHPWREDRDRIVLSCGHICPAWYVTLAHAGYFSKDELSTLRKIDSRLQGHPYARSLPGVENTGGPLGQGISLAAGMAMVVRTKWVSGELGEIGATRIPRVICLTSDGELQEGQTWEAAMFASKNNLDHLTFITDRNHIQIDGYTENVMPLEPLAEKIGSFGFHVLSVDGHNIQEILNALQFDLSIHRKPVWIIANTIPGKGVSFMENMPEWHGKPPMEVKDAYQAVEELHQLRTLGGKIRTD
jgi:transketolase